MSAPSEPVHAGATVDAERFARIAHGVRARSLPKAEWTHGAHLVFAVSLIDEHGLAGAEAAAPSLIRAYNEATGGVNDDKNGYHETLTVFFLRRVARFIEATPDALAPELATTLLASPLARSDYPLSFYSKALLFSVEARRDWTPPDLKPMDADD